MKPTPMTGEEQKAALGNVKRIPTQVDMFTGELVVRPPKRGNGSHIALKPVGIEKAVVPGMANHAGEGPHGKYCSDCAAFGEIAVQRPDGFTQEVKTVEMNRGGCAIWANRMGHAAPLTRIDIKHCSACKEFSEPTDIVTSRRFIVSTDGTLTRLVDFPRDLKSWRPT